MLRVEMLPAGNGDCLWIEYGSAIEVHRILIDAGRASTYKHLRARILALPAHERIFELLVVTHIDNDHIEGVIPLLQDATLQCRFKDVWYNGWPQLATISAASAPKDTLGPSEGEFVGVLIEDQKLQWNASFNGGPVVVPGDGDLPVRTLDGGLRLTLLSPTMDGLTDLRRKWRQVIADLVWFRPGSPDSVRAQLARRKYLPVAADQLGVQDGPPGRDNSEANGSSIALLAEYNDAKALLTGDSFASVLADSIKRLHKPPKKPLSVDVWKLCHHGSWANFSPDLFDLIRTPRYLVSTDGSGGYGHPHGKTLDHIVENYRGRGLPELVFNYRTKATEPWANPPSPPTFKAVFPQGAALML
jgi:hypothetical protein